MKQRTNIQIEHETLVKLRKLKITKLDTYTEIIERLMKKNKGI